MRIDWTFLAACLLLVGPASLAGEPEPALDELDAELVGDAQPEGELIELETVVIVGGFATPKLWKVSKDDHVMWVLGSMSVPAGVKWRSEQLDARVAESQLVLYPGWSTANPDIGVFKAIGLLTLLPSAFKAAKNPDGKTLKDVLPPETYARWRVLKTQYAERDNDLEKWRPSIALAMLEDKIGERLAPKQPRQSRPPPPRSMGPALRPLVDKAAKQHKVKVRTMPNVERKVKIGSVREMLKSVRDLDVVDVKCVAQYLDYLERKIEYTKQKASGTAQGDAPPRGASCNEADLLIAKLRNGDIRDSGGILKLIDELALQLKLAREQLDAEWMTAAQAALAKNRSTFAMLSMNNVKSPTGYLAKLKELGYTVEEPD